MLSTLISKDVIESDSTSIFLDTDSLCDLASLSCLSNALRVDDEVVVIISPVSLSLYWITLFDNPLDNSDIDFLSKGSYGLLF